jgi:hypothetical protein
VLVVGRDWGGRWVARTSPGHDDFVSRGHGGFRELGCGGFTHAGLWQFLCLAGIKVAETQYGFYAVRG